MGNCMVNKKRTPTLLLIMCGIMLGSGLGAVFGSVALGVVAGVAGGAILAGLINAIR